MVRGEKQIDIKSQSGAVKRLRLDSARWSHNAHQRERSKCLDSITYYRWHKRCNPIPMLRRRLRNQGISLPSFHSSRLVCWLLLLGVPFQTVGAGVRGIHKVRSDTAQGIYSHHDNDDVFSPHLTMAWMYNLEQTSVSAPCGYFRSETGEVTLQGRSEAISREKKNDGTTKLRRTRSVKTLDARVSGPSFLQWRSLEDGTCLCYYWVLYSHHCAWKHDDKYNYVVHVLFDKTRIGGVQIRLQNMSGSASIERSPPLLEHRSLSCLVYCTY